MNYNRTILGGRLTRDPELRVIPNGTAVCQFSIAVSRKYKTESGEPREEVAFIDCEAWGKTGENVAKYFHKGDPIFVEGRIKQDTWEDKNTKEKRSKLKISVDTFQFVESRKDGAAPTAQPATKTTHVPGGGAIKPGTEQADADQDVPF